MTNDTNCRFVSLAVINVSMPESRGTLPAMTHLAAIAMLVAERDGDGAWSFALDHCAIGAGEREDTLLAWATTVMPDQGTLIGWQLADAIVAPLLDAARDGDPELAARFLARFMALATMPSVDLAIPHGGVAAPSLEAVLAERLIDMTGSTAADVESAWAFGNVDWLGTQAEAHAVGAWRLWLAEANGTAHAASDAFEPGCAADPR